VPIPGAMLERIILFLQTGSADLAYLFLSASGMPVVRDGFVFYLPSLTIEVAKECSGIRSSLSLLVTGALAAYFFLRTPGARSLLVLTLVPIAIIKNAVRIFVLTALGVYVDPRIIASDLHRKGGFLFFLLALVLVGVVIVLLKRYEKKRAKAAV
jgi:exosortase